MHTHPLLLSSSSAGLVTNRLTCFGGDGPSSSIHAYTSSAPLLVAQVSSPIVSPVLEEMVRHHRSMHTHPPLLSSLSFPQVPSPIVSPVLEEMVRHHRSMHTHPLLLSSFSAGPVTNRLTCFGGDGPSSSIHAYTSSARRPQVSSPIVSPVLEEMVRHHRSMHTHPLSSSSFPQVSSPIVSPVLEEMVRHHRSMHTHPLSSSSFPQVSSPIVSPVLEEMVRHHQSMHTHPLLLSSFSAGPVTNRLTCFGGDGPSSSIHAYTSSPRRPQVSSPIVSPVLEEMVCHHRSMHTHPLLLSSSSAGLVTNRLTCFGGDGPSSSIHAYTSSAPLLVVRRSRHQSSHLFWRRWSVIIDPCIHILCFSPRRPQVPSPIVSPVVEEMVRHHRSMHTHPLLLSSFPQVSSPIVYLLWRRWSVIIDPCIHILCSSLRFLRSRHQSSHLLWRRWSVIIDPCIHILCSSPRRPQVSSSIVSPVLEEMVRHHRSMHTHPLLLSSLSAGLVTNRLTCCGGDGPSSSIHAYTSSAPLFVFSGLVTNRLTCCGGDGPSSSIHAYTSSAPLFVSSGFVTNRLTCCGVDGPSSSIHAYTSSASLLVVRRSRHQSSHLFWRRWAVIVDPCIHILCSSLRFLRSRHQSSHLFWRRWSVIIDPCIPILCFSPRCPQVSSPIVSPVLVEMVRHHRSMHTHPLLLSSSSAGPVTNRLTCFGGDGPSSSIHAYTSSASLLVVRRSRHQSSHLFWRRWSVIIDPCIHILSPRHRFRRSRHQSSHLFWRRWSVIIDPCIHILCSSPRRPQVSSSIVSPVLEEMVRHHRSMHTHPLSSSSFPQVSSPIVSPVLEEMVRHHRSMHTHTLLLSSSSAGLVINRLTCFGGDGPSSSIHAYTSSAPLLVSSGLVTNRLTCCGGDGPSSSIHAYTSSAPLIVVRRSRHQSSHRFWRRWSVIIDPCVHILCSSPRRPQVSSPIVSPVVEEMVRHHRSMHTHPLLLSSSSFPQVSSPIVSPLPPDARKPSLSTPISTHHLASSRGNGLIFLAL